MRRRTKWLAGALLLSSACTTAATDNADQAGTGGSGSGGQQVSGSGGSTSASGGTGGQSAGTGGQSGGSGGQASGSGGKSPGTGGAGSGGQGGTASDASPPEAPQGNDTAPDSNAAGACGAGTGFDLATAGLALDRKTCLVWERIEPARDVSACPLMIRYFDSQLCWAEATKYCTALRLDGKSDWRLPTIAELETIVIKTNSPTLDKTVFPQAVLSIYWSSEKKGEKIVAVDFSNLGMVNDHIGPDGPQAVRCVRGPIAK